MKTPRLLGVGGHLSWLLTACGSVDSAPRQGDTPGPRSRDRPWQVTAAGSRTCALSLDGKIACWGDNSSGQLGLGDTVARGDGPGEMGGALENVHLESADAPAPVVRAVALGVAHGCTLLDGGSVKCWGDNSLGQLGLGDTRHRGDGAGELGENLPAVDFGFGRRAAALAAGGDHTCALLDDGSVTCWGDNSSGQLGLGDTENRGDDPGEMGESIDVLELESRPAVRRLSLGYRHSCALFDDGSVTCWGDNSSGQLGLGDTEDRGDDPEEAGDAFRSVELGAGHTAIRLVSGYFHVCVTLDDGSLKCWGDACCGQLGIDPEGDIGYRVFGVPNHRGDEPGEMGDALPAVDLGNDRIVLAVAPGRSHTCVLLHDRAVKCWGANLSGELGLGDTAPRGDEIAEMGDALPVLDLGGGLHVEAITAGAGHTCALLIDTRALIKCWGNGDHGALGLGDLENRGDGAGEMGDALPAVDF